MYLTYVKIINMISKELLEKYRNQLLNIDNNKKLIKRKIYKILEDKLKESNLCLIGLRQVGKTVLIEQLGKNYFNTCLKNISTENDKKTIDKVSSISSEKERIFYINLKAITNIQNEDVIDELRLSITNKKYKLIIIDEIQMINNWTNFLQTSIDLNNSARFIVSGSNAMVLKKETMVGRIKIFYVQPLFFTEYKKIWNNDNIDEYLKYGSYPKNNFHNVAEIQYRELVEEIIIDKIINEDLKIYIDGKKFKSTMKSINNYIGSEFRITNVKDDTKISRQTVTQYIKYMANTSLIHCCFKYNDKNQTRVKKIYYEDKSMIYYFNNFNKLNDTLCGSLIENIIFNYLKFNYGITSNLVEIMYFRNKIHKEIDFIVPDHKLLIECKYHKEIDHNKLSTILNETIKNENFNDYRKIVIIKNEEEEKKINNWEFIALSSILNEEKKL